MGGLADLASWTGLLLIFSAVMLFDKKTPTPSLYTLVPTIGAVLIITFATPVTYVGRLLGTRAFVGLGLISYSAYLWHQPILAFARHLSLTTLDAQLRISLVALTFTVAFFSWKFVEEPFRRQDFLSKRFLFSTAATASLIFMAIGLFGYLGIFPKKDYEALSWTSEKSLPTEFAGIVWDGEECSERDPARACILGNPSYDKLVVIAGDSHARVLTEAAMEFKDLYRFRLIDYSASACPFMLGLNVYHNGLPHKNCTTEYQIKRLEFLEKLPPALVILHARFPLYINRTGFDNKLGGVEEKDFYASSNPEEDSVKRYEKFADSLNRTIQAVLDLNHQVMIVGSVPTNGWDPVRRLFRIEALGIGKTDAERQSLMGIPLLAVKEYDKNSDAILADIRKKHPSVIYFDPKAIFCRGEVCTPISSNKILYANRDHLSYDGAKILFEALAESANLVQRTY